MYSISMFRYVCFYTMNGRMQTKIDMQTDMHK